MKAYFVAGTDTGVGKTLVSCALLKAANQAGLSTAGMKPVAAGAEATPTGLRNEDALLLQQAASLELPYEVINPVCLRDPLSPHLAAQRQNRRLEVAGLLAAANSFLGCGADFVLVEGAGGWRVPVNAEELLSDLALGLRLPVILVVGMRLGCLNHALLTAEAIRRDGLELAGWVANGIDPDFACRDENILTLQEKLDAPMLAQIPWCEKPHPELTASYFSESVLDLLDGR
jgi:dethiobiotin synthetase